MKARKVGVKTGLFKLSVKIGLKFPFSKLGLTRLLIPMDIARYFEIPTMASELCVTANEKILDLSSPKLLAAYLASEVECNIEATDIYKKDLDEWGKLLSKFDQKFNNINWRVVDGRKLPYKANSFDKAYSISVLEHIKENGDIKAIKELARVVKSGGLLAFTVPVDHKGEEAYKNNIIYGQKLDKNGKLFWSRRYTPETLVKRLIKPSGLKLKKLEYCYEKYPLFSTVHSNLLPWSVLFGWLYPIIARISLKRCSKLPKNVSVANALVVLTKT